MAPTVHEDFVMQFRGIVFLVLWTALAGPILAQPASSRRTAAQPIADTSAAQPDAGAPKSPPVSCLRQAVR